MKHKGIFITLDGPEGCGKSTQARLLAGFLENSGYKCLLTREPGGTWAGDRIREILLSPDNPGRMNSICETLLFEADRSVHVEQVIRPALKRGRVVICDRFSDATMAYQGYAGGLDVKAIKRLDDFATGGLRPDLSVFLDISVSEGLKRAKKKRDDRFMDGDGDRMERKPLSYHKSVRAGYCALAGSDKKRIRLIKTQRSVDKTQELIRKEVLRVIRRYEGAR